jgi:replicative DNA helicase
MHNELKSCGGLEYLNSLDDGLPQIYNLEGYVRIIEKKSDFAKPFSRRTR